RRAQALRPQVHGRDAGRRPGRHPAARRRAGEGAGMKPKLLFATGNAGKVRELRLLVGDAVEVVSLKDLPPIPEPVEDAATFEENAVKKAREYSEATGLPALADDSGLCVDALGGRPGVHSARYAPGSDKDRYEKLLSELADVPDEKRTASF